MSTIADALVSLGVSGYSLIGEPTTEAEFKTAFTGTTDKTWAEIKAEKERIAYVAKRKPLYPLLEDFADAMYWNSKGDSSKLTAYYAACEKVKTDNPKPS